MPGTDLQCRTNVAQFVESKGETKNASKKRFRSLSEEMLESRLVNAADFAAHEPLLSLLATASEYSQGYSKCHCRLASLRNWAWR